MKKCFRARGVTLRLRNHAQVIKAGNVMGIQLQPLPKISFCLVESPQVQIRDSEERIGPRRILNREKIFELLDGLVPSACHEVALAECCDEIGALRRYFDTFFEKWYRIFEIVLRHTDLCHQEEIG